MSQDFVDGCLAGLLIPMYTVPLGGRGWLMISVPRVSKNMMLSSRSVVIAGLLQGLPCGKRQPRHGGIDLGRAGVRPGGARFHGLDRPGGGRRGPDLVEPGPGDSVAPAEPRNRAPASVLRPRCHQMPGLDIGVEFAHDLSKPAHVSTMSRDTLSTMS
jgi:hypothetical protein